MKIRIDRPDEEGQHDDGMMPMMAAMMAICLGVLTLAVLLPAFGLAGAFGLAVALGAASGCSTTSATTRTAGR